MILTTNINIASEEIRSSISVSSRSFPKTVVGPSDNNNSETAVYKLTEYAYRLNGTTITVPTPAQLEEFDADKDNIHWALWVDGGLMNNREDYINIADRTLQTEPGTDFTLTTDKNILKDSLASKGYLEAMVETTYENGDKINKLSIKFSKWLDGKTVYVEAFRNTPDHDITKAHIKTTLINAAPEIVNAYWINQQQKFISSSGFNANIALVIISLGLTGSQINLTLHDDDSSEGSTDDLILWPNNDTTYENSKEVSVTSRTMKIPYTVESSLSPAFANAFEPGIEGSYLELYLKISGLLIPIDQVNNKYAQLQLTILPAINRLFFASKSSFIDLNGIAITNYTKLNVLYPGMTAYLVAEATNLNGSTVSFFVTEESTVLVAANEKLPLIEGGNNKTDFIAMVVNDFAEVPVKFQELDSATYGTWNLILDNESEEGLFSSLIINTLVDTDAYTSLEQFKLKSSVVRYVIKPDGITKHHRDVSSEARYIFKESSGTLHYLTKVDFISIDQNGKNYIYPKPKAQLVDIREVDNYANGSIRYNFAKINVTQKTPITNSRYWIDIDALACMIAAMIEVGIEDLRFNGFSTASGGPGNSSSHFDGMTGDLGYLNANEDANIATWLSIPNYPPGPQATSTVWNNNQDFDYDRQVLFNEALYRYGFSKFEKPNGSKVIMLSENFVRTINGIDETKLLPHTIHYRDITNQVFHYHHLHVQGLDITFFELEK